VRNRSKWEDFITGFGVFLILMCIITLFTSIGDKPYPDEAITIYDAFKVLFYAIVYAIIVIDIYKFLKDIK
jgi:hypothetical protein